MSSPFGGHKSKRLRFAALELSRARDEFGWASVAAFLNAAMDCSKPDHTRLHFPLTYKKEKKNVLILAEAAYRTSTVVPQCQTAMHNDK